MKRSSSSLLLSVIRHFFPLITIACTIEVGTASGDFGVFTAWRISQVYISPYSAHDVRALSLHILSNDKVSFEGIANSADEDDVSECKCKSKQEQFTNMTIAGTRAVVNTGKGKMDTDLKKSRWVWRPKGIPEILLLESSAVVDCGYLAMTGTKLSLRTMSSGKDKGPTQAIHTCFHLHLIRTRIPVEDVA
ncbi:hypothetical protein Tco_0550174 [Tanacetum coccineum]